MDKMLLTQHLDAGYNHQTVIGNINLDVLKGQLICLLGPNGAGKSTVLRTLSGLLAPVGGSVSIKGVDLKRQKKAELAKELSVVLTSGNVPTLMTVREMVAMGRMPYTRLMGRLNADDWMKVEQALSAVGSLKLKDRLISELSDGERQKVMIARALVQEPELIILDEPTSHLDIGHKIEVIRILQKLVHKEGITCILSLHDLDLALKGCERILLVNEGKILSQGSPEEILTCDSFQKLYGIAHARYNELLGAVEFQGPEETKVFVTGGNGTGLPVYRSLTRKNIGIAAGILHENDVDAQAGRILCHTMILEKPFECIASETIEKAVVCLKKAEFVVDTNFPVGTGNTGNRQLIWEAALQHKVVFSLRSREESFRLFGQKAQDFIYCHHVTQLAEQVERAVFKSVFQKDKAIINNQ